MLHLLSDIARRLRRLESRRYGLYRAVVTSVDDPLGLQRIRVKVPVLLGSFDNARWCAPSVPFSGPGYGDAKLPEVGSTVLIGFLAGDINSPVWIGGGYHAKQRPPEEASATMRVHKTASGHILIYDDTPGEEAVHVIHKNGSRLTMTNDRLYMKDATDNTSVVSKKISLGSLDGSAEPVVLGDTMQAKMDALTDLILSHMHGTAHGPSTTPLNRAAFSQLKGTYPEILSKRNTTD
jgi:hypothetical protein